MKKAIFFVCGIIPFLSVFSQNPIISDIISRVSIDSLMYRAEEISGHRGVTVFGVQDTIASRNKNRPGNELAFQYIKQSFLSYGLQVDSGTFGITGKNIWAIQPGTVPGNAPYIICGHYDGMPNTAVAPAADDDGSGTVTVLEAARVLSAFQFEHPIIYAIWDEEEYSLAGSYRYATDAMNDSMDIAGVINMDAIAWDGDNDSVARVHARPAGNSEIIADTVVAINLDYNLGIDLQVNNPGATYSDHASFWNRGYGAVLIIQDWDNDPNPHYHTVTDSVTYFNQPYFHKMARLSIASVAALAIPVGYMAINENVLPPAPVVYPNPVQHMFYVRWPGEIKWLSLTNMLGQTVYCTVQKNMGGVWMADASGCTPGMYVVTAQTESGLFSTRIIKTQ